MKRIRKKVGEDLSDANIARVIKEMHTSDSSRPAITKKEACHVLKISYNTQRLEKILEEYNDKVQYRATRKQQKRGTRATPDEISDAIRAYIRGEGITYIAASLFRSVPFVRSIIDTVGVPTRGSNEDERTQVAFLPEQAVATNFTVGELVWSAVRHSTANIVKEECNIDYEKKYGAKCYQIYVNEMSGEYDSMGAGYYASSLAYDLGSLHHLTEYGIDLKNIS